MKNKRFKHQLRQFFQRQEPPENKKNKRDFLLRARDVYEGSRKKSPGIGFGACMLRQFFQSGWKLWAWQLGAFAGVFALAESLFHSSLQYLCARHLPFLISILGIGSAWSMIPVYYRSLRFRMAELEGTGKYGPGKLLLGKILLLWAGDGLLLGLWSLAAAVKESLPLPREASLWFGFLFFLANGLLLYLLRHVRLQNMAFLGTAVLLVLLVAVNLVEHSLGLWEKQVFMNWEGSLLLLGAAGLCLWQAAGLWKKEGAFGIEDKPEMEERSSLWS